MDAAVIIKEISKSCEKRDVPDRVSMQDTRDFLSDIGISISDLMPVLPVQGRRS